MAFPRTASEILTIAISFRIASTEPGQTATKKTTLSTSSTPAKQTKSTKHSSTTTTDSSRLSSTPTLTSSSSGDENNGGQKNDETLAIIFGVILGVLALVVMVVLIWCLIRRRKKSGSFGGTLYISSGPLHVSDQNSSRANMTNTDQDDLPALLRPGPVHRESSRSRSEDNAFYTPLEQPATLWSHHELDGRRIEQQQHPQPNTRHPTHNQPSSNPVHSARTSAPFSPLITHHPQTPRHEPLSPLDPSAIGESDDIVSPILPSRSFERRNSPLIHYPSMDEVNDFDFYGRGKNRVSVDSASGGWRWHPSKERQDGRYELAA